MSKNRTISGNQCVVQKVGLESHDLDGETVMMNIEKGKYYCFNTVGSRIWELVRQPVGIDWIKTTLMDEFEIDEGTCEESVYSFINKLIQEELISLV